MADSFFTIYRAGSGETVEKKSRFLGETAHVESEQEALEFLEEIRKKYYDARHHCFAYIIGDHRTVRASDDGEPQGTAGRPILDVMEGRNLRDAIIIVTRYFGGTLLGTGGLVRNYTGAAVRALENSVIIGKKPGTYMELAADYTASGKLQYLFGSSGIPVLSADYGADVRYRILVPDGMEGMLEKKLSELSAGKIRPENVSRVCYSEADGDYFYDLIREDG